MKKLFLSLLFVCTNTLAAPTTFNFIIPVGPGSATDIAIETYAPCFVSRGITVTKEFHPGADGLIAVKRLQSAQDTDSTVNILAGNFGLNMLTKFPDVDMLEDIHPLTYLNSNAFALLSKRGRFANITDIAKQSKDKPLAVGYVSASPRTSSEYVLVHLGVSYQLIPYKVASQATIDLMSGDIDLFADSFTGNRALIESGKMDVITSALNDAHASQFNHKNVQKISTKIPNHPVGTILSVKPTAGSEVEKFVFNTAQQCGKDEGVKTQLDKRLSHPVFVTTAELRAMIKHYANK